VTPELYRRIKEILQQALEREGPERDAYLESACEGDHGLRDEVDSLLIHHGEAGAELEQLAALPAAEALAEANGASNTTSAPPDLGVRSVVFSLNPHDELAPGTRLSELKSEPDLPEIIGGGDKFRVQKLLGEGGMGKVYLAYDCDLRRHVALKTLTVKGGQLTRRFLAEAQVLGQLQHPNIVAVYELGLSEDGRLFYTMPVVHGRTLREILSDRKRGDSTYSLARMLQIFLQILQAVQFAHEKGVIHRDLKPENVMLGAHGEVQVLDWGLSKLLDAADLDTASRETTTHLLMGTPGYMAPEQLLGKDVDERSDVYALGSILYELLTRSAPYPGNGMSLALAKLEGPPESLRVRAPELDIPLELEKCCLEAIATRPEDRQPSAAALAAEIQDWLDAETDKVERHARANAKAEEARTELEEFERRKSELAALESELEELSGRFESWQPIAEKRELLAAQDQIEATRAGVVRCSSRVVMTLTEALGFQDDNATARELLADYYWGQFSETEAEGHVRSAEFFAELVERYHDGKYTRELRGDGSLSLRVDQADAEILLYELVERELQLQPVNERRLGHGSVEDLPLAMGSYLAVIEADGFAPVRYPVCISRNRHWNGAVKMITEQTIGAGFIHIPAGPFMQGGDAETRGAELDRAEPELGDYFIGRDPVTLSEYIEFLAVITTADGLEAAQQRAPRPSREGQPYLPVADGRLELPKIDPEGHTWYPNQPAMGISWYDALAYCEWRTARDGREYRLPTEQEWEKAARGVDGRWHPWGPRWDASLCHSRMSRPDLRAPVEPVDAHPSDVSVYGVRGMAGNVQDWTSSVYVVTSAPDIDLRVTRGGGWGTNAIGCRSANRNGIGGTMVYDMLGFRIAWSPDD